MRKAIIRRKLDTVLLPAMRRHGIDLWLVLCREFHPDPMLAELGGGWPGVRNAYVFADRGGETPEKMFIGSHEHREDLFADLYDHVIYYGYSQDGLAPHLRRVVEERDPHRIGINTSRTLPMADGLSASLREFLEDVLGPRYAARFVSAELLCRDFRATRLPEEDAVYARLCHWTVAWCATALSRRVIWPGVTTTDDIHWWMRDVARRMGLDVEFVPGLRINRAGEMLPVNSSRHPILPGDVVTLDAGLAFDLYRSDYQRIAYVLRPGESQPPTGVREAFAEALAVRDRLVELMRPGEIAYRVWEEVMEWAAQRGYQTMYPAAGGRRGVVTTRQAGVYCHSIGNATHDIGARIAVNWPMAYGDRVGYPLEVNQWYSVELGVYVPVPEWHGRAVFVGIEEDVVLREHGVEYFAPPQEDLILIPP
ncbi:MAG: M24 family metallopeptidase [Armatimonadota bacterium]|nr:M24 family metallopeptidase [Armatimonadota bacterium]MDR7574339.1 M24 family metallopeptidase [Armatimonadota bacterium]